MRRKFRTMKRTMLLILCAVFYLPYGLGQIGKYNLSLTTGIGATVIDVEKAIDSDQLEDWNTFSYGFLINGEKKMPGGLFLSAELGWQQLYYWEEYYFNTSGYRYHRWGDVSTLILGGLARKRFTENISGIGGLNIRIFTDESGTTLAIPFGLQYRVYSSRKIEVPLGFRTDVVFGNSIPVVFNLTIGLKYYL